MGEQTDSRGPQAEKVGGLPKGGWQSWQNGICNVPELAGWHHRGSKHSPWKEEGEDEWGKSSSYISAQVLE